jgi:hypothetical protein
MLRARGDGRCHTRLSTFQALFETTVLTVVDTDVPLVRVRVARTSA